MSPRLNSLGQPIGAAVPDWKPRARPPRMPMAGRYCQVEPLAPARHAPGLQAADSHDPEGRNWTYLGRERLTDPSSYLAWAEQAAASEDPLFHAIVDGVSGEAVGIAAYLRIDPPNGVIEVGHLNFSPLLQRTRVATEAMFLMMRRAFDQLGYRRYEWKCDALNAPSRAAAERLGFKFEGVFRQAVVVKGRNRDSAWYSIIDAEWPALRARFERWLDPANFDASGAQRTRLR